MIVETALALGGALATAAVGLRLTSRLGDPQNWRRPAPRDTQPRRQEAIISGGFEPLNLGPDPMRWPSEMQHPDLGRPEPPWPSQTWDDPHFGAHWRTQGGAVPVPLTPAPDTPSSQPRTRKSPTQQPSRPQSAMDAERARAAQARAAQEAREAAARLKAEALKRAAQVAAQSAGSNAPSAEEIEQLVSTVGLAGTVQEIMRQTGWSFQEAAHHLARTRQTR